MTQKIDRMEVNLAMLPSGFVFRLRHRYRFDSKAGRKHGEMEGQERQD